MSNKLHVCAVLIAFDLLASCFVVYSEINNEVLRAFHEHYFKDMCGIYYNEEWLKNFTPFRNDKYNNRLITTTRLNDDAIQEYFQNSEIYRLDVASGDILGSPYIESYVAIITLNRIYYIDSDTDAISIVNKIHTKKEKNAYIAINNRILSFCLLRNYSIEITPPFDLISENRRVSVAERKMYCLRYHYIIESDEKGLPSVRCAIRTNEDLIIHKRYSFKFDDDYSIATADYEKLYQDKIPL